jgi:hypothetical protein
MYWGTSIRRSELVRTIEYGEITEYMTPRRAVDSTLDPDEARFFMVPEGDVSGTPASFLVQQDPSFAEDTVLTVGLSAVDGLTDSLTVSVGIFYEAELSTPPAGMATSSAGPTRSTKSRTAISCSSAPKGCVVPSAARRDARTWVCPR